MTFGACKPRLVRRNTNTTCVEEGRRYVDDWYREPNHLVVSRHQGVTIRFEAPWANGLHGTPPQVDIRLNEDFVLRLSPNVLSSSSQRKRCWHQRMPLLSTSVPDHPDSSRLRFFDQPVRALGL